MNGRATLSPGIARLLGTLQVAFLGAALLATMAAADSQPSHGFTLYTDAALRDAAAHWQYLDPAARRELLTELRQRHFGRLRIRREHRFGYRLQADGQQITVQGSSTVHLDTHDTPFGSGFERRRGDAPPPVEPTGDGFRPVSEGPPP